MRDIWFRGKSIDADCDEFYYGDLMHDGGESYCMYLPDDGSDTAIDIDTVGQFTGMYDFNGKEIYEGDIIKVKDSCAIAEVVFKQGCWCVDNHNLDLADERFCLYDELKECDWEVVGNIHDNPELRKKVRKNETN